MSNKTLFLTEPLYQYLLNSSLREPEILKRLREETSHDPMAQMQISPEQGQLWREAKVDPIVELRLAPGIETMDHLLAHHEAGKFDFVFIDADKKNYDGYYERALSLLRPGGLIAIDNVFWGGRVADSHNHDRDTIFIRDLNEKIRNDPRVDLSMIPIGDGLMLVRKR